LRINNQSFSHLWENEKTKRNFEFHENIQNTDKAYEAKDYSQGFDKANEATSRQKAQDPFKYQVEQGVSNQLKKHANEEQKNDLEVKREKKKKEEKEFDYSKGFSHGFEAYDTSYAAQQQSHKPAVSQKSAPKPQATAPVDEDFWTSAATGSSRPVETNHDEFAFRFDQPKELPKQKSSAATTAPVAPAGFDDIFGNVSVASNPSYL
jgi:hypothetical protein